MPSPGLKFCLVISMAQCSTTTSLMHICGRENFCLWSYVCLFCSRSFLYFPLLLCITDCMCAKKCFRWWKIILMHTKQSYCHKVIFDGLYVCFDAYINAYTCCSTQFFFFYCFKTYKGRSLIYSKYLETLLESESKGLRVFQTI